MDLGWPRITGTSLPFSSKLVLSLQRAGTGLSQQERTFELNFSNNQDLPVSIESGDFNGDGAPDVASSFGSPDCGVNPCGVSVLINQPAVEQSDGTVAFGTVNKGSNPSAKTFTFTNHSGVPTSVRTFVISGDEPMPFSVNEQCGTISPGEQCSPKVSFSTGRAGTFAATLAYSFDGVAGEFRVVITGTVTDFHGKFDRDQVAFGNAQIGGGPLTQTVTLTADGESGLTTGGLTVQGRDPGSFSIANDQCSNKNLASGNSCTFDVRTALNSAGAVAAQVDVPSNGSGASLTVPLSATGVVPTYEASLKLTGPKKVKAGKKFKVTSTVTNTGTGVLDGLVLAYKATQGKALKSSGQIKLDTIATGMKLVKAFPISPKLKKLTRGKPLTLTATLTRKGRTIASRSLPVRLDFGQMKANRK